MKVIHTHKKVTDDDLRFILQLARLLQTQFSWELIFGVQGLCLHFPEQLVLRDRVGGVGGRV